MRRTPQAPRASYVQSGWLALLLAVAVASLPGVAAATPDAAAIEREVLEALPRVAEQRRALLPEGWKLDLSSDAVEIRVLDAEGWARSQLGPARDGSGKSPGLLSKLRRGLERADRARIPAVYDPFGRTLEINAEQFSKLDAHTCEVILGHELTHVAQYQNNHWLLRQHERTVRRQARLAGRASGRQTRLRERASWRRWIADSALVEGHARALDHAVAPHGWKKPGIRDQLVQLWGELSAKRRQQTASYAAHRDIPFESWGELFSSRSKRRAVLEPLADRIIREQSNWGLLERSFSNAVRAPKEIFSAGLRGLRSRIEKLPGVRGARRWLGRQKRRWFGRRRTERAGRRERRRGRERR